MTVILPKNFDLDLILDTLKTESSYSYYKKNGTIRCEACKDGLFKIKINDKKEFIELVPERI